MSERSSDVGGRAQGRAGASSGVYDAFISYSQHGDKAIAEALRSVIQTIGKPWWKLRSINVFLDAASLSAAPGLWESIAGKLDRSRYLILLASPEAAKSVWVNREVAHFLAGAGATRLLIGLTDGELAWDAGTGDFAWSETRPFPPSLRGRFTEEPLWVDLRPFRTEPGRATKADQGFLHAALDLAATIKGVEKADLYSDELRQQRRSLRVAYGAAGLVGVLAIGATAGAWIAVERANEATRNFNIARETVDKVVSDVVGDLKTVHDEPLESVRKILTVAQAPLDRLFEIAPDDPSVRASRVTLLANFGETYSWIGDSPAALVAYEASLSLQRGLAAESDDPKQKGRLANTLTHVAAARLATGDRLGASGAVAEALAIVAHLRKLEADNLEWQRIDGWATVVWGDLLLQEGKVEDASTAYELGVQAFRHLSALDPADAASRDSLAASLYLFGTARYLAGDRVAAEKTYTELLVLRRAVHAADPKNTEAADLVASALTGLASVRAKAGNARDAGVALYEAERIRRRLVLMDRSNAKWVGRLAATLTEFGKLDLGENNPTAAMDRFDEAKSLYRELIERDPTNLSWREKLVEPLYYGGKAKLRIGRKDLVGPAVEDLRECVEISRGVAASNSARDKQALAAALIALGDGLKEAEGTVSAQRAYAEAQAIYPSK